MAYSFPYGYSGQTVTEQQLATKRTWVRLHPEMRRRALALFKHLADKGVPLGVGTGWRVQPAGRAGFASPGNSYHESFPSGSSAANALAIDTVPASSWNAMEVELGRFGLRSFRHVNNEPWHIQPSEIRTSRNWATVCPTLSHPALPGGSLPVVMPTPSTPAPTLRKGASGLGVIHLQNICHFWGWRVAKWDGYFDHWTEGNVKVMQNAFHITADGVYGPQTRQKLIEFLRYMQSLS